MIVALVLAALGTAVIVAYVQGADERAAENEELVSVLRVQDDIPEGTPVEDFGDRVAAENVPARLRADGAVASLQGLSGRVAGVDLLPGEQVVAGRLVAPGDLAALNVPPDHHQVTISLEATRVVGGQVRAGDRVAVVGTIGAPDQDGIATHMMMHKVQVVNVRTVGDGTRVISPVSGPSPVGTLHVTLALLAPDVERVVHMAEAGSIWLSLEPDAATDAGTRIVTSGNVLG